MLTDHCAGCEYRMAPDIDSWGMKALLLYLCPYGTPLWSDDALADALKEAGGLVAGSHPGIRYRNLLSARHRAF